MPRAVFLDRDGTINTDVGDLYESERLRFIRGSLDAMRMLQPRFALFVVTNQPGIGEGRFTEEAFAHFSRYFDRTLKENGVYIKKTYCCPHARKAGCLCMKPSPFFLKSAKMEFDVDLAKSFVVGDHPHDVEMSREAGCRSVYVLTGHGRKHRSDLAFSPDFTAENLLEAARWILGID